MACLVSYEDQKVSPVLLANCRGSNIRYYMKYQCIYDGGVCVEIKKPHRFCVGLFPRSCVSMFIVC